MKRFRGFVVVPLIAGAMIAGGALGATVLAHNTISLASAASPSPGTSPGTCKSNESASHEKGESASREAAENNCTFHPGGPGGPWGSGGPGPGHSNETSSHEASESAAQEAAENTAH